jgi:hypothetical protein
VEGNICNILQYLKQIMAVKKDVLLILEDLKLQCQDYIFILAELFIP